MDSERAESGCTSPLANQSSVKRGVVAESSTLQTHSINISTPEANQV